MNAQEEQWLTGFTEGDGSVFLNDRCRPVIGLTQKDRSVLDYISTIVNDCRIYNYNGVWELRLLKNRGVLEIFSRHTVSRHFLARLNTALEVIALLPALQHRPTIDWLTGFWDADGTSDNTPSIFIDQKERGVLESIKLEFGGSIGECSSVYRWHLSGKKASALMREILSRSHCPAKVERLHNNLEGLTRIEERRLVRAYIREHPEVVEKLCSKP